ncbi:MAG: FAD-binding protein [Spirochaetes bacterium]|nr:FAD-binding protein [Spirochaetota bacterium]
MKIIVCIKQVPDTSEIKINYLTNTIDRSSTDNIINPYDLHAIEEAVKLKEKFNAEVSVITMGPQQSESALREALARGADYAFLLCDKYFAGADTFVTSYTLSKMIEMLGRFDLILCGKQAIDGETAQVGPELAEILKIPLITYVNKITDIKKDSIEADCLTSSGTRIIRSKLPALITVTKAINIPRLISLTGLYKSFNHKINIINSNELNIDRTKIGLKGSPTKVKKIKTLCYNKKAHLMEGTPKDNAIKIIELVQNKINEKSSDKNDIKLINRNKITEDKKIFIIGEMNDHKITTSTYQLTYIAKKLSNDLRSTINLMILTDNAESVIKENPHPDVHNIIIIENHRFKIFDHGLFKESIYEYLQDKNPEIILGTSSYEGRTLLSCLASKFRTGLTADCTGLDIDPDTKLLIQTRPAYGGNILASIECENNKPQMATIRPNTFPYIKPKNRRPDINILKTNSDIKSNFEIIKDIKQEISSKETQGSEIFISGGRGIGSKKDFNLLYEVAQILKAEVGASRSAVDAGWISYNHQIGQTGKTVSPKVYIACGISGAAQHLAGMQSSELIIAINKDENAQIFNFSDYGIIGDYRSILNEMFKSLKEKK